MSYLCSLLWPFIEGYWITAVYLFALRNRDKDAPFEKFASEVSDINRLCVDKVYRLKDLLRPCMMKELFNSMKPALLILSEMHLMPIR